MTTRDFNSYPSAENLIQLERKHGDALDNMDMYCLPKHKKGVLVGFS
jgi:hypothetical protein